MRYDAANHPNPSSFDQWRETGICPYQDQKWERSVQFREKISLWSPGPSPSALNIVERLFKAKDIKR